MQYYKMLINDLLKSYNAPKTIDQSFYYTDNNEFNILETFDFLYDISIIKFEHNFTKN